MKFAFSRSLWQGRSSTGCVRQGELDPAARPRGRASYSARDRHAARRRQSAVRLDDAERHEQARDRRAVVDAAERVADAAQGLRLMDGLVRDRRALDEPGDEVALRPDERGDLGPDADAGGRDRRGVLDLAADPEQVGVVAGEPDDVAVRPLPADDDEEVAVGDPAGERP